MLIATPPRPRPSDLREAAAVEALREQALIEEARRRARRRRTGYAAVVVGVLGIAAGAFGFGRLDTAGKAAQPADEPSAANVHGITLVGKIVLEGGGNELLVVNPDGSGPQTTARCPATIQGCAVGEPAWSPDGTRLAFVRGASYVNVASHMSLFVENTATRTIRRLATCGDCSGQWGGHVRWSPDGTQVAYSRGYGSRGGSTVWIAGTSGGRPVRQLTRCPARFCADVNPVWSPSGHVILFTRVGAHGSALYSIAADGSHLTRVVTGASDAAWSPDGARIAFDEGNDAYAVDADGSHRTLLISGARGSGPNLPAWSPDGRTLVYFSTPGTRAHFVAEVWTINSDGSGKRRLYRSACCVGLWAAPIWSPDGRQIAFSASSAGGTFVMNADGSRLHRVSKARASQLAWRR
ncbi:MAG: hypothetical protein WAU41_15810 [Gaiellaceae bacterium]